MEVFSREEKYWEGRIILDGGRSFWEGTGVFGVELLLEGGGSFCEGAGVLFEWIEVLEEAKVFWEGDKLFGKEVFCLFFYVFFFFSLIVSTD